ncbi:MAG: NTP transferase domain-containing protein [bacterium]|nr:NTP transferase domain-containing protein [bacterium]
MSTPALAIVILAAGKGTRMNSDLPKVLHEVAGRPLILRAVDTAGALEPGCVLAVVGFGRELVDAALAGSGVSTVVQDPPLGTGHAVLQVREAVPAGCSDVLILTGDVPLLRSETLRELLQEHAANDCVLTVLSTQAPNPYGYGRIVRDIDGEFTGIVEEKDATPEQRNISEINSGVMVGRRDELFWALRKVKPNNAKGEYYLTDIVGILDNAGHRIQAVNAGKFDELQGINTPEELARAEAVLAARDSG